MNWNKRLSVLLVVATLALSIPGIASAQGPERGEVAIGARALVNAVADLSGLEARELLQGVEPDSTTLAEIATTNGLTTAQVVDAAADMLTGNINDAVESGRMDQQQADDILATLNQDLEALMNETLPGRLNQASNLVERLRDGAEKGLIGALSDATGLEPRELATQAIENQYTTLAELAEANGADPDAIAAQALANVSEQINTAVANNNLSQDQADQLLERLPEVFENMMTHDISRLLNAVSNRPSMDITRAVLQAVSASTGLNERAILQRVQQGESMATILESSGVSTDSVITSLMAEITPHLEEQITNILNATRPARAPRN